MLLTTIEIFENKDNKIVQFIQEDMIFNLLKRFPLIFKQTKH